MRAALLCCAVTACGSGTSSPIDASADAATVDAPRADATPPDASPGLPYLELPTLPDYNHASETVVAASGDDVVVLKIDQRFPSADSFEYPATDDDPTHPFRRIACVTSHDRGDSFSAPAALTLLGRTDPVVAAAADGSFWAAGTDPHPFDRTDLFHSTDGGDTFALVAIAPIRDKSWLVVDEDRRAIWLAGSGAYWLIGFDASILAMRYVAPGMAAGYADAAGGHFLDHDDDQIVLWDGGPDPIALGAPLPSGNISNVWTRSAASMGLSADGSEWILRATHDSVVGSPVVVRLRRLPDEGIDVPISPPGTVGFLPAGALDTDGRLHAVWYDSSGPTGRLVYARSETTDLQGAYATPVVVDPNACPGDGWYPYDIDVDPPGGRRLREYIGIAVTGNRAIIAWTHAPDPPSRVRVAHVDF